MKQGKGERMITDEMVEVAVDGIERSLSAINGNDIGYAKAALTAAYPLIRKQILEEVATMLDVARRKTVQDLSVNGLPEVRRHTVAATLQDCAQAIRNLAESSQA